VNAAAQVEDSGTGNAREDLSAKVVADDLPGSSGMGFGDVRQLAGAI
jgi:hypothetical protein